MLVFWDKRLVFLAVPKTGTTALEHALSDKASMSMRHPPQLKHTTLQRYNRFLKPFLTQGSDVELETFAIIRAPLDRLGSWYRYRSRDALVGHQNSTRDVTFDQFILAYCDSEPPDFAKVGRQDVFLTGHQGQLHVDHLYQYEQIEHAIAFLENRIGTKLKLPQANVSPKMSLTLSATSQARLESHLQREYDLWDSAKKA